MSTYRCQAKDPASCRYHGSSKHAHVRILRDKLNVARSVYQAAENTSVQFSAYEKMREAEIDYYATDEGSQQLAEAIKASTAGSYQDMLMDISTRAENVRLQNEKADTNGSFPWMPSTYRKEPTHVSAKAQKPSNHLNYKGQRIHLISEGTTPSGKKFDFSWNASTGILSYGEFTTEGVEDVSSMKSLGRSSSEQEAKSRAAEWYNTLVD